MIKSIKCPIQKVTAATPDRPAMMDERQTLTYKQLDNAVDDTISNLRKRGITAGDVVAVLDNNSIPYAILFYAAFRLGFTLMPLNARLTESNWQSQMKHAKCSFLIHGDGFDGWRDKAISIDDIFTHPDDDRAAIDIPDLPLNRDALIIFSSGSSGASRGVVLTWSNLYYSSLGVATVLSYEPGDSWMAVLPFFHIGGISILFRGVLAGCGTYVVNRFDPDAILKTLEATQINYLSVVPTMLRELILKDRHDHLKRLKAIIVGGAPFDESIRSEAIAGNLPVLTTYGMTETSSMITLLQSSTPVDKLTSSGKVLPYRELVVADDTGRELPPLETGRIMVRGEVLFSRYLDRSQPVVDAHGWFDTGDIGQLDHEGYLKVIGRIDNIIISGGENIDLNKIEEAIRSIDGITDAVVLPRQDQKWGERPIAFAIVTNDGLTEESIKKVLQGQLAPIMIPDRIIITDSFPLTGSGKYDRQTLRDKYREIMDEKS